MNRSPATSVQNKIDWSASVLACIDSSCDGNQVGCAPVAEVGLLDDRQIALLNFDLIIRNYRLIAKKSLLLITFHYTHLLSAKSETRGRYS